MRCYPSRWLWGLIPIAMLSWIAIQSEADRIEQDLEQRSRRALDEAGHGWASIVFSGRDGLLVGTAPRQQDRAEAITLVSGVWGVRIIEDRVRIAADAVIVTPVASRPTGAVPHAAEASHRNHRNLPPAIPLQARTFTPRDAGGRSLAGVAPALMAAEVPHRLVPHRPRLVSVITREVEDAPALSGGVNAESTLSEPEKGRPTGAAPDGGDGPPPVPVRRPATATVRGTANVPLPARKVVLGPAAPAAPGDSAPPPSRKAATAFLAGATASSPPPIATAAVGEDGAKPESECRAAVLSIGMSGAIRFARNKASLNGEGRAQLDRLAEVARMCPRLSLSIAGHADARGSARRNLKLSQRRAAVAVSYLINKGIDAGRLQAVGYGETRPVAPNDTAENRAKNRRIEVETQDPGRDPSASPAGARQGAGNGLPDR